MINHMKLLVAEDEPKLNKALSIGLRAQGYCVDQTYDGEEAERFARTRSYDVIILDIMMPKQDGFKTCERLRQQGVQAPILFLTARDAVEDRVAGLRKGGDDYVIKPFSFDELAARVEALHRRASGGVGDLLRLDELQLDVQTHRVVIAQTPLELTVREFGLLEYLLRHPRSVVTREELLTHVWDEFYDGLSNVVDVHMKNLRKKLPKAYAKRIQTVWGKGYRLD